MAFKPLSTQPVHSFGPPSSHLNGVLLAGQWWPAFRCLHGREKRVKKVIIESKIMNIFLPISWVIKNCLI